MLSVFPFLSTWKYLRRLAWLSLPVAFSGVVAIAFRLTPSPAGVGTHRELGLPPCPFFYFTGLKCPGCGLTTSFTCLVHFQWLNAFKAHPLGPFLFLLFALLAIFSLLEFANYLTPLRKLLDGHYSGFVNVTVGAYVGVWILRMFWALV